MRTQAPTATADPPKSRSLADAALAPVIDAGRAYRLSITILGALVLAGAAAYGYQLARGLGVTGLNDQVFWAVYETDLVTFIGFSYGGALASAILRLTGATWRGPLTRIAEGSALVTLLIGALFPIVHLGRPELVWEMFVRPNHDSPIFWDMVAIITYLLLTMILFTLALIPDLGLLQSHPGLGRRRQRLYAWAAKGWRGTADQRRSLARTLTTVAILIIPVAVMVHTVLAYAFSLTSRPGWNSTIYGPYFVVAAIYSGVALVILCVVAYRKFYRLEQWIPLRIIKNLAYLMVALGITYGYFMLTEITREGYVGEESSEAVLYTLMLSRYAPLFWTFVIAALIVPVILIAIPRTRTVAGITVAAALVVGSLWLKRYLMFVPPLTRPLIAGEYATYTPTWVETTVTIGAWAGIPLLLMLLFRVLPVLSPYEMAEAVPQAERITEEGPA
jgi:molybdopterin-containing oxidoreductase family membrane subunit